MNRLDSQKLNVREFRAELATFQKNDDGGSSVRVVATTEQPVTVFDWERLDIIDEVLRVDGMRLPAGGRVPLLNSHSRFSVDDILGSAIDFGEGEAGGYRAIEATVSLSDTAEGRSAAQKIQEGHLTDFSVGYRVEDRVYVPEGETAVVGENEYEGPVSVVRAWTLKELSATPIGADSLAKARSAEYGRQYQQEGTMENENRTKDQGAAAPGESGGHDSNWRDELRAEAKRMAEDATRAERERIAAIQERCAVAGCDDLARELIRDGVTVDAAAARIFERMAEMNPPVGPGRYANDVSVEADDTDKFRAAAIDGFRLRLMKAPEKPAVGADDFRGRSLVGLAREILRRGGVRRVDAMSKREVAEAILSGRAMSGVSTSDFPYILGSLMNTTLRRSYEYAPSTWRPFVRITSADDFRDIYGVQLSEAPSLELIRENGEYVSGDFSETRVSYNVKSYGRKTYLTRQMIVNDRLGAFDRIPELFGASASRKESDIVYALITGNPDMPDGVALFHADHGNLETTDAEKSAPDSDSLSAARKDMRLQTGVDGSTYLNLTPQFALLPVELETTTEILLRSAALPEKDYSGAVVNPWQNRLTPISDPRLSDDSTTAWYLVADPSQIDTINVAYLDGQQAPRAEWSEVPDRQAMAFYISHDFGAGVMDHRGFFKNPGTT